MSADDKSRRGDNLPQYGQLPLHTSGGRSGWHLFGRDDDLGLLVLQDDRRVLDAAREIRRGRVFSLNAPVDAFSPPLFGRAQVGLRLQQDAEDGSFDDELTSFNPQSSSQWDSLAHVPLADDAFYNGVTAEDIRLRRRNTIDHWARRGIVGRGVLLDVAAVLAASLADYAPDRPIGITVDQLEECRTAAGIEFAPGDVLMLYTGFGEWYGKQSASERTRIADHRHLTATGLDHSEAIAQYLWNTHVSAVVSDNPSVEVWPPDWNSDAQPFGFLHRVLIGLFGIAVGELWSLSELAEDCREDGCYSVFVASAPMHVRGGISSSANALAIK